jgi:hypothetical protein
VVEADRGQGGHRGTEGVGRIEPAAQSGLDRRGLDSGLGEPEETGRHREFELGDRVAGLELRVHALGGSGDPAHRVGEITRRELLPVDQHALRPA